MPATSSKRQTTKNARKASVADHARLEVVSTTNGLDDIDRQIISHLQEDGRRAYGAIAGEVGLSEAGVRRRVQRLRDMGVMQIVAITDPLQLGYGREALIGIRVHGDVRLVADRVAAIDEANYVVMTAGSFDIIAEVIAVDDAALVHLLNDAIRSIPGVTEVETFLYLKLSKQTYTWGTK
ncbi:MAG: Lrp/AsnC family transcriptional regulator [Actinomycetales bacterium]|nr:Lrp/AsnC family transcriptional regulator [Actinomycetales bacterium]